VLFIDKDNPRPAGFIPRRAFELKVPVRILKVVMDSIKTKQEARRSHRKDDSTARNDSQLIILPRPSEADGKGCLMR